MSPFWPGEKINVRFEGDPERAELRFNERTYTVENGGLYVERDGGLIAILDLPWGPGKWAFEFVDGDHVERGHYRTVADDPGRRLPGRVRPEPPSGVQG